MSQDKLVAEQEPIAWMHGTAGRFEVIHAEVKKLWERVGQPAQFAKEVVSCKVENYTIPLYSHAAPCARCAEAERIEAEATAKLGEAIIRVGVLQDNVAKQAAEIERLSSHVEDAKGVIQKMMKAEKQQADRIKTLEAELEHERMRLAACGVVALANTPESAAKQREMLPEYESGSLESVKHIVDSEMALRDKLAKADAVIETAGIALQEVQDLIHESRGIYGMHMNGDESPWIELEQGGRFERLCTLPDALSDIEQYQKGE